MPTINVPVSNTLELIERPVILSVVRQLQDYTGISSKTLIRFFGQNAAAAQINSTLTTDNQTHNLWPVVEALTIEVEEDYNQDRIMNMVVKQPDVPFVFLDSDLGFFIKPAYSSQDVTIRFKYKAKDKNQANKWRNEIRTRVAMNRSNLMHTLTYSYHLPDYYISLIKEIHTLRENIGGYGDTFDQYMKLKSTNRLKVLTNQAGTASIYAIAEQQAKIVGSFDFEGAPEKPEKEGEDDNFTISFSYKFRYDKPINTVCRYPFLVHQQFIDEKYQIKDPQYSTTTMFERLTSSGEDFAYFDADNQIYRNMADRGIGIPYYDDFLPAYIPTFTLRMLTVLLSISETDKRTLFNLQDLGDYNINSTVLGFMKTEYPYMTSAMNSVFYCQLYENENSREDAILSIDSNLNVVATADLDVRKQYRVRVGLVADMNMLTSSAVSRLRANKPAMNLIVSALNSALKNSANQMGLNKSALKPSDLSLLGLAKDSSMNQALSFVQQLYIGVSHMNNYKAADIPAPDANTTATQF